MKYIVYLSTATHLMNQSELLSLLNTSRRNNQQNGLTGMLLYSEGTFIQLLEGDSERVSRTYESILSDERHKNIIKLTEGENKERQFPDWSMGFKAADAAELAEFEGYINAKDHEAITNKGNKQPLVQMLKVFAETNRM
ncbi:BLUF domain-containing protein [Mucilaginibacter sp.]